MERALLPNGPKPASPADSADRRNDSIAPRRILIVEEDASTRDAVRQALRAEQQVQVDAAVGGDEALRLLAQNDYQLVVMDLCRSDLGGTELVKEIREQNPAVGLIVLTGGDIGEAVQGLDLNGCDFLRKPFDVDHLRTAAARALHERALRDELTYLRNQLRAWHSFHDILSKNPRMQAIFELIRHIAPARSTVLIEGETGTGKERIARAIHQASPNRTGPFVAVRCAALPEGLLESELFGHEKGSFAGAVSQRRGRFETAHEGVLFLDEAADVPLTLQAKLVRVLQERRFEHVGGAHSIEVDVRVIAATSRSLKRLVAQATFREDLYHLLNAVKIDLPPLRERPEDIPLLATHFAAKHARPGEAPRRIAPRAMEALLNYRWPGNVRELENAVERACLTSGDDVIHVENLPPEVMAPPAPRLPFPIDIERPLPEVLHDAVNCIERQYISKALKKTRGNVSRCARICGMSRRSITGKIAEYKLDKSAFK